MCADNVGMHHITTDTHSERVEFRVRPEVAARIDACATYIGMTRAAWLRLAVAVADTDQTLAELTRLDAEHGLTPDQQRVRDEALTTRRAIEKALRPKPLIPMSGN